MKTFFLSILVIFFLIFGLILLSIHIQRNDDSNLSFYGPARGTGSVENSIIFEKEETALNYNLTYGWCDYTENIFNISFAISKKQLAEAEKEYGYYPDEFKKYLDETSDLMTSKMIEYLKDFARQEITKSKYSQYIRIKEISADKFNLSLSVPAPLSEKAKAEFKSITEKIFKKRESHLKKISKELKKKSQDYFEKRGIRTIGDKVEVDYDFCVRNNRPRLKQVFELMKRIKQRMSIYQFLSIMLAFIQEIRYRTLPLEENNKFILEFWVPLKVLVNNMGDCDSKAITFASIWTHFKSYPMVLIQIKRHLLIGVAVPSSGEATVTIHGLRYTLCEVSGPAKIPPGLIHRYSQIHLKNKVAKYQLIKRAW